MQQISNQIFCDDFIANLKLNTKLIPNSYHDYPYLIIKGFLSKPVCKNISDYAHTASDIQKAKIKSRLKNSIVDPSVNEKIRKTVIHKLPDTFLNEYESSFKKHQAEIEKFFNLAITKSTKVQVLEYTKGSFYIKHADDSNEVVDKMGNTVGFKQVAPERKLSTVLFTTSYEKNNSDNYSFKGGQLRFNYMYDKNEQQIEFFPEAGDMIVFPSNPIYSHEVIAVQSGYRLTLVQWHDAVF